MDELGRYYTRHEFSQLLISHITVESPRKIIELGVGDGSLIKAAIQRWCNASYYATDIDAQRLESIKEDLPFVNFFEGNTLDINTSSQILKLAGGADVAVCNPPYLRLKDMAAYKILMDKAKLRQCRKLSYLTSDIVFLAQNLTLMRRHAQLGIILPDSLITGKDFINFREALLENHSVSKIIQLPENIFSKTEALTHMLFLEKDSQTKSEVDIYHAGSDGTCSQKLTVASTELVQRMDYKYHYHIHSLSFKNTQKKKALGTITEQISRGCVEQKNLKQWKVPQVHTTSLSHGNGQMVLKGKLSKKYFEKYTVAEPGDILLARVGRGCMGKVSMVKSGHAVLSDCVYRIRVPKYYQQKVFKALCSKEGQQWIKALSHGVCAKVLSKADLLNFPV